MVYEMNTIGKSAFWLSVARLSSGLRLGEEPLFTELIEETLDRGLPATYDQALFTQKCELVYQHVYDSYYGQGRSIYEHVA